MDNKQNFLNDLKKELSTNYLDLYYKTSFKELYIMLEDIMVSLRQKYGFNENPVGTNTIIVMFLADLRAAAYNMIHEDEIYDTKNGESYHNLFLKDGTIHRGRFKRSILDK